MCNVVKCVYLLALNCNCCNQTHAREDNLKPVHAFETVEDFWWCVQYYLICYITRLLLLSAIFISAASSTTWLRHKGCPRAAITTCSNRCASIRIQTRKQDVFSVLHVC